MSIVEHKLSQANKSLCFLFSLLTQRKKKRDSNPGGERRLNCCDTAAAQNLPRRRWQCGVKRSFHIVALYIKSQAAPRGRGAFVFKIMSMVYDKNVNSLEIIAFELDQGSSNLKSYLHPFIWHSQERASRIVVTLLRFHFERKSWRKETWSPLSTWLQYQG